jgi:hypothetical protein
MDEENHLSNGVCWVCMGHCPSVAGPFIPSTDSAANSAGVESDAFMLRNVLDTAIARRASSNFHTGSTVKQGQ